jgi:hypothetical protein
MDEFRLCKQCHFVKPLEYFYVSNQTKCKECVKAAVRANRAEKIDYYRSFDRARGSMPHRVAARLEYQQTPDGRAAMRRAHERYCDNHPERRRATITLNNAVRDGKVQRQPCWVCGEKAHGHHPDYDRPLEVVWLCPPHHRETHAAA